MHGTINIKCIENVSTYFEKKFFAREQRKRMSENEWFYRLIERLHSTINTLTVCILFTSDIVPSQNTSPV